jgi:superfamily II DNA or RNA helicase
VAQLPLDFTTSAAVRHRKAVAAVAQTQPELFPAVSVDIDVHLGDRSTAVASLAGPTPERAVAWLRSVTGAVDMVNSRRVKFPSAALHKLLWVCPPTKVTMDAAATVLARAQWAKVCGLPPLVVQRKGSRLVARSKRGAWPFGMRVVDAPWPALAACVEADIPLTVDLSAQALFSSRLNKAGVSVAHATLAGSTLVLTTTHPSVVENMGLEGLSYDGSADTGRYKLPLTLAEPLLDNEAVTMPDKVRAAIKSALRRPTPLTFLPEGFPWTLYAFQAIDAGHALKIVAVSGGVLLAGDMGSGKTTVSLALAAVLGTWPLLVVAPLSAFSTWERQLGEMGKSFYLATETPAKSWEKIEARDVDAVVISYDRLPAFLELIDQFGFAGVIADEVQRIRNPGSRRSRALRAIAGSIPIRIGLSGTPITNTMNDVLPIGAFLAPSEWPPRASHRELSDVYPGDAQEALTAHLSSLMVRRRMSDVPVNLPKRVDHRIYVQLSANQRRALDDLTAQARHEAKSGEYEGSGGRMHAFARLQMMRRIVNDPDAAGVGGPNPKVTATMDLVCDMIAMDRKGVIFCADRNVFTRMGQELDKAGIGWVGMWGSTPAKDRVANEKRFHSDPDIKVVLCTIQAGSESWSASPTATWLVSMSYMYSPSMLAQMEARVYRMNSDPDGPDIHICYVHASAPGGTLDDRMVEIVAAKKELFAAVIDRDIVRDETTAHVSMQDLLYMLTGKRHTSKDVAEADAKKHADAEQNNKSRLAAGLYRLRGKNKDARGSGLR